MLHIQESGQDIAHEAQASLQLGAESQEMKRKNVKCASRFFCFIHQMIPGAGLWCRYVVLFLAVCHQQQRFQCVVSLWGVNVTKQIAIILC